MRRTLIIAAGAALLAATSVTAAQAWDDPPGWAWQQRGILDSQGIDPNGAWRGDRAYDSYGYVAPYRSYGYRSYGYRGFRPDNPPGARYQDQGVRDWDGSSSDWW